MRQYAPLCYTSPMLENIHSPADIKRLSHKETEALASEIRQTLIDVVAHTGGHLASNLGTVELTLALHRVFDSPKDKIVFDVGHQGYTHKLITGRRESFDTLRMDGGLSGFLKRSESPYDCFGAGHASTAISAALGFARARDLRGEDYSVVALVGDGALTGGLCYEALNDAGSRPTQLIMLLNDNEMSIAKNVGALSTHLTKLRGSPKWIDTKQAVKKGLNRIPLIGPPVADIFEKMKRTIKLMLVPGEFFEALGFGYLGPIDGHDIQTLERALSDARAMQRPVVVHAVTQKGRGYELAERKPDAYHGVAPFFVGNGKARTAKNQANVISAGAVAGETLTMLAAEDERIVAITAAMPQGTGLTAFAEKYPDRFFDVGIAEEHAVTLAAGMAAGGLAPVFAVYASFLQRAVDQLLHDACLQNLHVTLLVDHAGFVPGDGATHQGVYDLSMLCVMPNLTVWAPCDAMELRDMIKVAMMLEGPCVIRYPKDLPERTGGEAACGAWRRVKAGVGPVLIAYGHSVQSALEVAGLLEEDGQECQVWSASSLKPLDTEALDMMTGAGLVAVLEEGQLRGGLGEAVAGYYAGKNGMPRVLTLGVSGIVPGAHSLEGLALSCSLDAQSCARRIREAQNAR